MSISMSLSVPARPLSLAVTPLLQLQAAKGQLQISNCNYKPPISKIQNRSLRCSASTEDTSNCYHPNNIDKKYKYWNFIDALNHFSRIFKGSYKDVKLYLLFFEIIVHDRDGLVINTLDALLPQNRNPKREEYTPLLKGITRCLLDNPDRWICSRSFVCFEYSSEGFLKTKDLKCLELAEKKGTSANAVKVVFHVGMRELLSDKIEGHEDLKRLLQQLNSSETSIQTFGYCCRSGVVAEETLNEFQDYSHLNI